MDEPCSAEVLAQSTSSPHLFLAFLLIMANQMMGAVTVQNLCVATYSIISCLEIYIGRLSKPCRSYVSVKPLDLTSWYLL